MKPPGIVIVLGPYRSGTSITSRMLASLGVDFGPPSALIPANSHNPSGYYERDDINHTNQRFFESAGGTHETPGTPDHLLHHGDLNILRCHDFSWLGSVGLAGIKDPRMCATLAAWFEAGVFNPDRCKIVHVTRDLDATLKSALRHDHVAGYGERDPDRVRRMLATYADYAQLHLTRLPVPALTLPYENVIANPMRVAEELARFLGIQDRNKIQRAAAEVGKDEAQVRLRRRSALANLRLRLAGVGNAILRRLRPRS